MNLEGANLGDDWLQPAYRAYLGDVRKEVEGLETEGVLKLLLEAVGRHEEWIDKECINLYAATNLLSSLVRNALSSTIATRVAEGHPGAKYQRGCRYIERIEAMATELAKKIFRSRYAECRVLSGSMANNVVFNALTEPGDVIMALTVPNGGHISHQKFGVAGYKGLSIAELPFDEERLNVNVDELRVAAGKIKPKLIILGASLILFPYPIKEVREIADEVGAKIHYDGAHVLGLIAGGEFQKPLEEGASVLSGSTYKTFWGPPGGLILSNEEEVSRRIDEATFPGMTANVHYSRIAGLVIAILELMEYGREYATQTVKNARALGEALHEDGFHVLGEALGYTRSHQLAVDVSELGRGREASKLLERANIICNSNLLPCDTLRMLDDPSGLRLGVQEVTRLGMKEAEMEEVAGFMRRVLIEREEPEKVAQEVRAFRRSFTQIHYCLNP